MNPNLDLTLLLTAALISALAELVLHYLPWRLMLGRELPPPWTYVLGSSAMLGPYAGLLVFWVFFPPGGNPNVWPLAALVSVVLSSGIAVIGAYLFDAILLWRTQANERLEEIDLREAQREQTE